MQAIAEMVEQPGIETDFAEGGQSILSYFQATDGDANNGGLNNGKIKALLPTVTIVVSRNNKDFSGCASGETIITAISLAVYRATGVHLGVTKYKTWSMKNKEGQVIYCARLGFRHETSGPVCCQASSLKSPNGAVIRAFLGAANEVRALIKSRD
jgi:hypothetical protein